MNQDVRVKTCYMVDNRIYAKIGRKVMTVYKKDI